MKKQPLFAVRSSLWSSVCRVQLFMRLCLPCAALHEKTASFPCASLHEELISPTVTSWSPDGHVSAALYRRLCLCPFLSASGLGDETETAACSTQPVWLAEDQLRKQETSVNCLHWRLSSHWRLLLPTLRAAMQSQPAHEPRVGTYSTARAVPLPPLSAEAVEERKKEALRCFLRRWAGPAP